MKKQTFMLMLFLLFAGAQILQAQRTITGTVISADDKQGIPQVQVMLKGTNTGTTTNLTGQYTISVPGDATYLVFTFVGMTTQEIAIEGRTLIDVVLSSSAIDLESVEILGYGSAREVGTTVGSVQSVTAKKLEARPVANVLDALQGQVAGLQVVSSSGDPTASASMQLHGLGSLGTLDQMTSVILSPLYIVDGIVVNHYNILAMNANDFESVSVLKDASATSIYGARAANGVIVITTKRGARNSDAKVTFRSQYGISKLAERKFYDNIMSSEELLDFYSQTGLMTQATIDGIRNNPDYQIDPATGELYNTKWFDVFLRDNVPTYQTDISVRGGGEKTMYFVSGSQFSQEGTAYGSKYNRYTVRSNIEAQAKEWLKMGVNLMLARDKRGGVAGFFTDDDASGGGGLAGIHAPWVPAVNRDGSRRNVFMELKSPNGARGVPHPEYQDEKRLNSIVNSQLTGGFFIEIEPLKGLKFIHRSGVEAIDRLSDNMRYPSYDFSTDYGNGYRSVSHIQAFTMTTNNVLEYGFKADKLHEIVLLAGHEGVVHNENGSAVTGSELKDDRLMGLENTRPDTRDAYTGQYMFGNLSYAFLSFFGRADYNYNNRFFADFSLRNDASSRFGINNRSAWFWSAGIMWNMLNESFVKNLKPITDARLKVSYGTQGNAEIGDYDHLATMGPAAQRTYNNLPGLIITNPGNSGLGWEKQKKLTIGLRAELVSKYRFEIDFYQRRTSDMFMGVNYPYTSGFASVIGNMGTYQNTGVDLNIGMDFIRKKDFFVGANVIFNYNKDKVIELPKGMDGRWQVGSTVFVEGQPAMRYYPLFAFIEPNTGRQYWYLPGENVDITQKDNTRVTSTFSEADLRQNTGIRSYTPINGGFSLNAGWKGITLSTDWAYSLGRYGLDGASKIFASPDQRARYQQNLSKDAWDYWRPDNPNAKFPDWKSGAILQNDDFFLSNASFLRLKNLMLSYNFDSKLLSKTKFFTNMRIYFTSRNLLTFTKYTGMDPESSGSSNAYVNSKQFQLGIEFGF
ncbi:MAG: SusC/RagA family TonB-linked outer membrane protein [Bacteroidales bacterium]|jgi:TonB-linked SusC/RagA family outer membrane protein|nr:SusC/RagA family TonB-linked outer membrane protein [Bacteroidales bacterium]